jgi:hypothetical protein
MLLYNNTKKRPGVVIIRRSRDFLLLCNSELQRLAVVRVCIIVRRSRDWLPHIIRKSRLRFWFYNMEEKRLVAVVV